MRKCTTSLVLGLLAAACSSDEGGPGASGAAARADGPVPVILVSLDTCRSDRLTPYGGPQRNSPALDALARESVVFTDCLAQSSNTGPSHRSLFTGQFVHRHHHMPGTYMRSPYSWAGEMAAAGYETAAFTGGGFLGEGLGFEDGFQTYVSKDENRTKAYRRGFKTILPQAEAWYDGRAGSEQPFFLFLHTYDIHCPFTPDEPYASGFRGDFDDSAFDLRALCGRAEYDEYMGRVRAGEVDADTHVANMDHLRNMYDGDIRMTDDQFGAFLEKLRADGTLDRSLLIVTSDHGESLGRLRPYLGHNHLWEEQLQVPLIIRFPGGAHAGTVSREPVMLVDLLPTVLDYLGLDTPDGVQGESLLPLIEEGASYGGERLRIAQFNDRLSFRFDQRWKVHVRETENNTGQIKLFDLQNDPGEQRSLFESQDPQELQLAQEMGQDLSRRFQEWLRLHREDDARFVGQIIEGELSEDVQADLSELGYVEDDE
jgi:arylsulfatase A-like enzyme